MIKDCKVKNPKISFTEDKKSNSSLLQNYTTFELQDTTRVVNSIHRPHQILATDLYDLAKYESDRKFLGRIANQRGNLTLYEAERFSQLCKELGGTVV